MPGSLPGSACAPAPHPLTWVDMTSRDPKGGARGLCRSLQRRGFPALLAVVGFLYPGVPDVAWAGTPVVAVRATADPRPDGLVKAVGDRKFLGNDIYSVTGAGQSRTCSVKSGRRVAFLVRAQNDSSASDGIVITGRSGSRHFRVRYYQDSSNVTAEVTGSGLVLPSLAPGDWSDISVKVKARGKAGLALSVWVSASSETTRGIQDIVLATVEIRR